MLTEFHSLYWPNIDKLIVDNHSAIMEKFRIPINYHSCTIDHGQWMDDIMEQAVAYSNAEIICFLDIDCIPISEKFIQYIRWARINKSFVGIAQVSNHIEPASHVYAAPAFFAIHKDCWVKMGKPSFRAYMNGDVAERLSYVAETERIPYSCIYPSRYYKDPAEGVWRLGNYGNYGIGTIFEDAFYHLYQSRHSDNINLFYTHCQMILEKGHNEFIEYSKENFIDSRHIKIL